MVQPPTISLTTSSWVVSAIRRAACAVDEVQAVEKLAVRRAGRGYWVDIHVEADPLMSLEAAHIVSGKVKGAIRAATPQVLGVLVHMEPHDAAAPTVAALEN